MDFRFGRSFSFDVAAEFLASGGYETQLERSVRFYRERRMDIIGLGDRWRALFYGAIAAVVVAMAARPRLVETGAGTLLWLAVVAGASYAVYRVWRHYREYA